MSMRKILALFMLASTPALASDAREVEFNSESVAGAEESQFEAASSPFHLAHRYRFSACNARQGAIARASWIMDRALESGEVGDLEYSSDQFRSDVARFIRGLCPNKR